MWTALGERLQHYIWIQLITLSLSPSLPIQSNEPTGSTRHFNVSSIASWSDSQTFQRILLCGFQPYFIKWAFDAKTEYE